MEVQTWPINRIVVKDRARTDVGDLAGLKESLTALGQLQPIAIQPDGTLVFGERRLAAVRQLGWSEIAVWLYTAESETDILRAEQDENTCRLQLTPIEAAKLRKQLAEVIRPVAKRRRSEGGARGGRAEASSNLDEAKVTRSESAKPTGYSASTLDKVDEILNVITDPAEAPEVREEAAKQAEELAKPGAKVDPAHKAVRQARAKAERKSTLSSEPLPGQWTEPPPTKTEPTLTRRLTDGINKGQNLKDLAVEINDQELDLDISTLYVLRNRMQDEISIRQTMKDALNQQIEQRGYSTRKASAR